LFRNNLFPNFKSGGFFAFCGKSIVTCVTAIPTVSFCGGYGKVKSAVIISIYQNHLGAENQKLCDFCRRCRFGGKNNGMPSAGSSHPCQSRSRISRGSGDNGFGIYFFRSGNQNGAGSIFKRSGRISSIIFDPKVTDADFCCQPGLIINRSPSGRMKRGPEKSGILDGQQRCVTPQRRFGGLKDLFRIDRVSDLIVIKDHVQISLIRITDIARIRGIKFLSAETASISCKFIHNSSSCFLVGLIFY